MAAKDAKYRKFIQAELCACQPCASRPEFHHMTHAPTYAPGELRPKQKLGIRGKGQKPADFYGLPLCPRHHGQRHSLSGFFEGWKGSDVRNWELDQVRRLRAKYEKRTTTRSVSPGIRLRESDALFKDFVRDNDLSGQQMFDLKALVEQARREGREEERPAGRRP